MTAPKDPRIGALAAQLKEAHAQGHTVIRHGIIIDLENEENTMYQPKIRLAGPPGVTPLEAERAKVVAAIAKALGLDSMDPDAIRAAFEAVVAPAGSPAPEQVAASKVFQTPHGSIELSARELSMCREMKAEPAAYAANKACQIKSRRRAVSR